MGCYEIVMIKALITDFDGTLVDTFEANLRAYQQAFASQGLSLSPEKYRECFGYRFERFMTEVGVCDETVAHAIKEAKKEYYPRYFDYLKPNKALIDLMASLKAMGVKTAIASTARKENLMNAVNHLGIADHFDLIFAGVDVKQGKPSPEIYLKAMETLGVAPEETLIFEDSPVGIEAAQASGAQYMIVPIQQFD
ncbi:HAD-superfamily hydrolase, subfamily IA, variant 3 [gut metagenome]|uniref:HAD-superfamily hydrolase, subfamily IA, variant 3 n=1 Tax=gut metagenome TaxID=749906 RepID=J9FQ99_9ZZZZ